MKTLGPARVAFNTESGHEYSHTPLVPVATIKDELRQSGTAQDARIERLERSVSDYLALAMFRAIENQERIHYFSRPPCGSERLIIREGPIREILAIEALQSGSWVAVDSTDYIKERLHDGSFHPPGILDHELPVIRTANSSWIDIDFDTGYEEPFRVRTTSGWSTIPSPIQEMALRMTTDAWKYPGITTNIKNYEIGSRVRDAFELYSAAPLVIV